MPSRLAALFLVLYLDFDLPISQTRQIFPFHLKRRITERKPESLEMLQVGQLYLHIETTIYRF